MALVETPDRIMSTGGDWGGGGNGMWILLLAFLFMFRGGFGHGGHDGYRDGGHRYADGAGCHDNYKRYDAQFHELRMENLGMQKTMMQENFHSQLRAQECCCQTQAGLAAIRAEVAQQGAETRCEMRTINNETIIANQAARIASLEREANREATIAGVLAGMHRGHFHGMGVPFGGFIPSPAGVRYEGYSTGGQVCVPGDNRGGCPADRF